VKAISSNTPYQGNIARVWRISSVSDAGSPFGLDAAQSPADTARKAANNNPKTEAWFPLAHFRGSVRSE
jgi:hypothetical protein